MGEKFNVVQIFPDETNEYVGRALEAEAAVLLARDYTSRPAAKLGIIAQVMITDMNDCCVFHWKHREGIVFPPEEK